jgi:hypothetical protein
VFLESRRMQPGRAVSEKTPGGAPVRNSERLDRETEPKLPMPASLVSSQSVTSTRRHRQSVEVHIDANIDETYRGARLVASCLQIGNTLHYDLLRE